MAGVGPVIEQTVGTIRDSAGKLEAWFAATMDRVSQRFTTYIRLWTVAFAATLALGTGLNSVTLLNTLYNDSAFRQQMTADAPQLLDQAGKPAPNADALRALAAQTPFDLARFGWQRNQPWQSQIFGVFATAALLTLGAPFWFNLLKSLTNLRPTLANKQDADSK